MTMRKGTIVFLCEEEELTRERKGYYKAFRERGVEILCLGFINSVHDHPVFQQKEVLLAIQPEASFSLPLDLFSIHVPFASFQIDTNHATDKRIVASSFFDLIFVFHPFFDQKFKEGGHANVNVLPHAIEKDLYSNTQSNKQYQVGWVGRTDGDNYSKRRSILPMLQERYTMNDPFRHYEQEELIEIYKSSEAIVNIAKDDYLEDANLRCFEAMASEALLFTYLPSELTDLGFIEGEHFIGFSNEEDLLQKLDFYLSRPIQREQIARQAKSLVLSQHTYHNRVDKILAILDRGQVWGNARTWKPNRQYEILVYYFTFRRCFSKAYLSFQKISFFSKHKWKAFFYLSKLLLSKKLHNEELS